MNLERLSRVSVQNCEVKTEDKICAMETRTRELSSLRINCVYSSNMWRSSDCCSLILQSCSKIVLLEV